ncbi:hypothetical protein PLICRDRAFT_35268 [Plicaturopsis crispa FD-325 SS-3]|nr:hypothetical protein PLICRDRAFT_35268 [Plicaturopsis crispa FD-325 SS-3]
MERARKAEDAPEDAKRSTKPPASVPDARTKHAAPHFAAAARKGGAAPAAVVPQPFLFTTEIRAREREKFDEALRVKEAELERQREERRRAQEEEEEREVRELRKRAVPRAHEVPDWYATVPKRSDGGRSTSS